MKILLINFWLALPLAAADSMLITNLWLNDQVVVEMPVGMHRVTTVSFPEPIQSIDGAGLTTDGRTPGLFQVAQSGGNSSLAFRALAGGASANFNVRLDDRTYAFLLTESKSPVLAVNFLGTTTGRRSAVGVTTVGRTEPSGYSPSQLVGLLDRARNYHTLRQHHPALVRDVTTAQPRSVTDYPLFTVRLEEVIRFDQAEALAFRVTLTSKTGGEVRYRAGSWAVRVGDGLYPQAVAEASGVIAGKGHSTAWFLIQGTPDGQRNLLSPRNAFIVLVNPL